MKAWMVLVLAFSVGACGGVEELGSGGEGGDASFSSLYDGYLNKCNSCHAPGAPGATMQGIETSLNFATVDDAHTTLTTGTAAGLQGNQEACNGISFVGDSAETSLLAAVLDPDIRDGFSNGDCDADAVSDMAARTAAVPSGFIADLGAWIAAGAPNN